MCAVCTANSATTHSDRPRRSETYNEASVVRNDAVGRTTPYVDTCSSSSSSIDVKSAMKPKGYRQTLIERTKNRPNSRPLESHSQR